MPVTAALQAAQRVTGEVPLPAAGRTLQRWQALADLAARDLTTARVVEAHLDAVAIRAEAGLPTAPGTTWGVFAAEAPDVRLDAVPADGDAEDGPWRLEGTKPWCSLAGELSHALVTAHTGAGRRLFAVDLAAARADGTAEVLPDRWHSRGLVDVPSGPVAFRAAPAAPVGEAGWYLRRPGFAHGGIGVAACWFGGAVAVAGPLRRSPRQDPLTLRSRGAADHHLWTARLALEHAAAAVDAGAATGPAGELLAARTRTVVATAAEAVLTEVGHALGPAPLTLDRDHAARVADLTVYLRQHHADRDLAALGDLAGRTGPEDERWPR